MWDGPCPGTVQGTTLSTHTLFHTRTLLWMEQQRLSVDGRDRPLVLQASVHSEGRAVKLCCNPSWSLRKHCFALLCRFMGLEGFVGSQGALGGVVLSRNMHAVSVDGLLFIWRGAMAAQQKRRRCVLFCAAGHSSGGFD